MEMGDNSGAPTAAQQWLTAIETADVALLRRAAEGVFAPRCEFRRPSGTSGEARFFGYEEWAPWIENLITAFHPLRPRLIDRFGGGDNLFCQLSVIEGTHSGTLALPGMTPVPSTGRRISFEELTYSSEEGGLTTRQWAYFDLYNILRQIGAAGP
jgi:predicted ester cyclase